MTTEYGTNVGTSDLEAKAEQTAAGIQSKAKAAANKVGDKMDAVANKLRERAGDGGRIGDAAGSMATQIERAGGYLREHDLRDIGQDMGSVLRQYPVQSALVGLGVGFLIGRAFTGSRMSAPSTGG